MCKQVHQISEAQPKKQIAQLTAPPSFFMSKLAQLSNILFFREKLSFEKNETIRVCIDVQDETRQFSEFQARAGRKDANTEFL
jgi:hypothetical protein